MTDDETLGLPDTPEQFFFRTANNIFTLIENREGDSWRDDVTDLLRQTASMGWKIGFNDGELDYLNHVTFDEPCIENPFEEEEK